MQPAPPPNQRIGDKSYKPGTGNTRKNKSSRNKASTYSAHKGDCPHSAQVGGEGGGVDE